MPAISSSVLSTRLGELTEARLVVGHTDGYRLTQLGHELIDALLPLQVWARRWEATIRC